MEIKRKICGVWKLEEIKNEEIRSRTGGRDIGMPKKRLKWRYVGHFVRDKKDQ